MIIAILVLSILGLVLTIPGVMFFIFMHRNMREELKEMKKRKTTIKK